MNLVINSTFRPFTFDEMVKPLALYKQEYDKVEQDYSDLTAQTEMWKDIANQTNSPEAYAMYNRYSQDLAHITESFSKGMNLNNRQALLGMKRRYSQDIAPIAQASEAMKAANELRDKLGSDAIFEVGRYNSLDDFLHGKTANNKYESRKDIATRTAALAQATAQSILEDPIIKSSMSPQFLEVIEKRGLGSLDELQAAIAGNPVAANRFAQIKSQMIDQLGGLDRFDIEGQRAVEGAIHEGMFAGLNNYQTSLQQDGEYMTKAQRNADARAWKEFNLRKTQAEEQANTSKLRPILGEDGEPTGTYYDPKIGMVVNENGSIVGNPEKIGTGSKTPTPSEKPQKLGETFALTFDMSNGEFQGSGVVTDIDPNKLEAITEGYDGLEIAEQELLENGKVKQITNTTRNNFNYFYAYFDKKGKQTTKYGKGSEAPVTKKLVIKDIQK